ncbi:hypothetical protein BZG36_04243 [Bifiguratus adelaidae]|uniref:TrmE-type G domain-containing protein n=1 Tax=Bifiguratus adelaidae TaxID=1938954 RepID=A0A261Y167_9FUNG|nr:hypothetical protein BZG36_04243 [Bifiguratus adelaidae]
MIKGSASQQKQAEQASTQTESLSPILNDDSLSERDDEVLLVGDDTSSIPASTQSPKRKRRSQIIPTPLKRKRASSGFSEQDSLRSQSPLARATSRSHSLPLTPARGDVLSADTYTPTKEHSPLFRRSQSIPRKRLPIPKYTPTPLTKSPAPRLQDIISLEQANGSTFLRKLRQAQDEADKEEGDREMQGSRVLIMPDHALRQVNGGVQVPLSPQVEHGYRTYTTIGVTRTYTLLISSNKKLFACSNKGLAEQAEHAQDLLDKPVVDNRIKTLTCGRDFAAALTMDGQVFCGGTYSTSTSTLCINTAQSLPESAERTRESILSLFEPLSRAIVISISAGREHLMALTDEGDVYTWGNGEKHQLGRRTVDRHARDGFAPERIRFKKSRSETISIRSIGGGWFHCFAVDHENHVWSWGWNDDLQCCLSESEGGDAPVVALPSRAHVLEPIVQQGLGVRMLTGGEDFTVLLLQNGQVWTWGRVDRGSCGIGRLEELIQDPSIEYTDPTADEGDPVRQAATRSPHQVKRLPQDISAVRCGRWHVTALTTTGDLWQWGTTFQSQSSSLCDYTPRRIWVASQHGRVIDVTLLEVADYVKSAGRLRYFNQGALRPTIFALSSGHGKAGVAIVRASGPNVKQAIQDMTRRVYRKNLVGLELDSKTDEVQPNGGSLIPRKAHYREIVHPRTYEVLDRGLVLYFPGTEFNARSILDLTRRPRPGPNSFTGEDVVEFHIHGGNAVVKGVIEALHAMEGFRLAERGEFARRAFDNDRLDLTEVEGLSDLINAETEMQRRVALSQAGGTLRALYDTWRIDLIHSMALFEAVIDFGEDEQIEDDVLETAQSNLQQLQAAIQQHLNDGQRGEILRSGVHVTISGPPNAGKSTLLNWLAKRPVSIVSETPGTTRDVVEASLNIAGYPVIFSDTAGLRRTLDPIEVEGIRRARERASATDIQICVIPVTAIMRTHDHTDDDSSLTLDSAALPPLMDRQTLLLINKVDQLSSDAETRSSSHPHLNGCSRRSLGLKVYECNHLQHANFPPPENILLTSFTTEQGLGSLLDHVKAMVQRVVEGGESNASFTSSNAIITHERYRVQLEACLQHVSTVLEGLCVMDFENLPDVVLLAEELRLAANAIGRITGRVDVEDVLDIIFSEFCIGK